MLQVSLRDANQHLSRYVDVVSEGGEVIITRRGEPIARLLPIESAPRKLNKNQRLAWERLSANMQKGYHLGGKKFNRDDAYER